MEQIKVLLIDDELEFVTALKERLLLRGIYADGALNGEQGIVKLTLKDFDVVLLDMKMPGMSCQEIVKKIREIRPNTKIILITGYGSIQDGEEELVNSAYHYFAKPIKIRNLINKIQEAVNDNNQEKDG